MITAFFRPWRPRHRSPAGISGLGLGKAGDGMAADGPGAGRLPCPCCARRAERPQMAAHRRILSALAVAGLTAMAILGTSSAQVQAQPAAGSVSLPPGHGGGPAGRITLIVIAVVAVAAFAVLQVIAWPQRRRRSAYADWRTWPPGYDPWADGGDPVAGQHEGSAYRPGYGFLPGRGRAAEPGPGRGTDPGPGRGTDLGPGRGTDLGPGRGTDLGPGRGTDSGHGRGTPLPRSVRDDGRCRSFTA